MTTAITIIIATACVAIALIVAAVIIAGKQMETEPKPSAEIKTLDVLYLCDRSGWCGCDKCGECICTTNIEHAKNFMKDGDGFYIEKDRGAEEGLCTAGPVDFDIRPLSEQVHDSVSEMGKVMQRAVETLKKNSGTE